MARKKKKRIGVFMGGPSSEYAVSVASGHQVLANLDKETYQPLPVRISKSGQWFFNNRKTDIHRVLKEKKFDIAFLALHGEFGEDGSIQSLLNYYKIPFTGSGVAASVLGMDKMKSRELFRAHNLETPTTLLIHRNEDYQGRVSFFVNKLVKYPIVVKPSRRGSSVGVTLIRSSNRLKTAIREAFRHDSEVLLEEFIDGRELTCGVLEHHKGVNHYALPVTEIIPKKGNPFFNYKAKYTHGAAEEITPAVISDELTRRVQETAINAHKILGCRGYSRSDMISTRNKLYLLEVNTLPGLTQGSLLPQQAAADGLEFSELLDIIISNRN